MWQKAFGDQPAGSLCGFSWQPNYGTYSVHQPCNGHNPATSCPPGYFQNYFRERNDEVWRNVMYCVKS